jgi:vitamin B12 transporter
MRKIIILLTSLLLTAFSICAQEFRLSGLVVDEFNDPIIGANIMVKGTYSGTTTEFDGSFKLTITQERPCIIAVSYLGYSTTEIPIEDTTTDSLDLATIKLKPKENELRTVTITAGAFEASDEKRGTVMKSLDIVTTAGATADIAGALNTLPGTSTVGEEGMLFVRGGESYETQIFIDGMMVQNPFRSMVQNVPARARFSPFLFKGTAFSTGGYSAEYGQALSSALVLNTHDLAENTQSSIGLTSVGLDFTHQERWENSSLAVTGNLTDLSPYTSVINQNIDWVRPFRSTSGQVIYRNKYSKNGIFKMHADISNINMRLNFDNPNNFGRRSDVSLTNDYFYFNSTVNEVIGDDWIIDGGITYNYNRDFTVADSFNVNNLDQLTQARLTVTRFLGNNFKLKFGGGYINQGFDQAISVDEAMLIEPSFNLQQIAAFAELDFNINSRFFVRIGERFESDNYLGDRTLSTRLALAYKFSSYAQLSAAFGQFYQLPGSSFMAYNRDLRSENALHYILNYQISKNNRLFRVEAYQKNYNDLIRFDRDFSFVPNGLNNLGYGFARGIDVFFRDQETFKDIDYWISYSYLDTERLYWDFPQAAMPNFASRHNVSAVFKQWVDAINSQVGITYTFNSGRPFHDPTRPGFNDQLAPAFHDLSANLSYITTVFWAQGHTAPVLYEYSRVQSDIQLSIQQ